MPEKISTKKITTSVKNENRARFLVFLTKYKSLVEAHRLFYADLVNKKLSNHGHALDHDLMVVAHCLFIAPDDHKREGELAAIAAMMHSLDRHFNTKKAEMNKLEYFVGLFSGSVSPAELKLIREAVAEHSKKNSDKDTLVTMVLKDADRLANSGPISIGRIGQHRPEIPGVEFDHVYSRNPYSTYQNISSVYDACNYSLEWIEWLRLPKAILLAKMDFSFEFTKHAVEMTKKQLAYVGVIESRL